MPYLLVPLGRCYDRAEARPRPGPPPPGRALLCTWLMSYTKGLHELGDGCFAYLQPDGGWGWSNAGLLVGDGQSLLVDTLFDLRLTAEMLDAMAPHTAAAPISHARQHPRQRRPLLRQPARRRRRDHRVDGRRRGDGRRAARAAGRPQQRRRARSASCSAQFFGPFDFDGIELTPPTRTFDGRLDLEVGGRTVELIEVGPAHTQGDVLVFAPADRAVFTGDILFIGGTPIVWAGPLSNWIAACDLILGLDVEAVVPGHGPVTDKAGVAQVRDYLVFVAERGDGPPRGRHGDLEAARDIALGPFGDWGERGRIAVNVAAVYRELRSRPTVRQASSTCSGAWPTWSVEESTMERRLGIDIGGTGIKGAPVDVDTGELHADRFRLETPKGAQPRRRSPRSSQKVAEHFELDRRARSASRSRASCSTASSRPRRTSPRSGSASTPTRCSASGSAARCR